MKIVIFQGGLGNQIFQYAVYKFIKYNICSNVQYIYIGNSHNGMEIDKYFDADLKKAHKCFEFFYTYCHKLAKKGLNPFISIEDDSNPFEKFFIEGYWQNKKYFGPNFLNFRIASLTPRNSQLLYRIKNENSVAIHVRRGDYLLPQYYNIYGNVCTKDYYNKAITCIFGVFSSPSFFIFSDDISWVKENLVVDNATYIDWNTKNDSVVDMFLMSQAKGNIIANSSFSFWGAYFNQNTSLVVYPQRWYNDEREIPDIFPQTWIGI